MTRRGLSLLFRNISDVTIGYLSNSSLLSCGNAFFLGVHLLSLRVSPSPNRVAFVRLWWCGMRAAASAGRPPRARHCDARCENNWRKRRLASGESIGTRTVVATRMRRRRRRWQSSRGPTWVSCAGGDAKTGVPQLRFWPSFASILLDYLHLSMRQPCPIAPDITY